MTKYTQQMSELNTLIDNCIDELSDDRVDIGVESLYELAVKWKTSGASQQSFVDICVYIETEAAEKSDSAFVKMKINAALKKSREGRRGKILRAH